MEAVLIRAGMVPGTRGSSISVAAPRPEGLAIPVPSADSTGGATSDSMGAQGSVPPVSLLPDPQRLPGDVRHDRPGRRPGRVSRGPGSDRPGHVRGEHYSTFAPEVCRLVKLQKLQAAETLLRELIEASEAEARLSGMGVASWYYEQLAEIYCAQGDARAAVAILTRFRRQRGTPSDLRRPLLIRPKRLTAHGIRPGGQPPPASAPQVRRMCALAGCQTALVRTQIKYCCVSHDRTAQRERRPA